MTQPTNHLFRTRDILVRAAAFVVLTAASTTLLALPYLGTARSAPEDLTGHSARLETAFQAADELPAQAGLRDVLLVAARKADRLSLEPDCDAQTWPWVHPRCLSSSQAAGPAEPVRMVTVEYRLRENGSALVRLPVRQLASRP